MEKFAVIKTGGKQYLVNEGQEILVEKIESKDNNIQFTQVLLVSDGQKIVIGQPLVKKATVEGKIVKQIKGKKLKIAKFRAKSRYCRVIGHRQLQSLVKITKISF